MHFSAFSWSSVWILFQLMMRKCCAYQSGFRGFNLNKCWKSDIFLTKIVSVSLQQCLKECDYRQTCSGINYRRTVQLCELIPTIKIATLEVNTVDESPCISMDKNDIIPSQVTYSYF